MNREYIEESQVPIDWLKNQIIKLRPGAAKIIQDFKDENKNKPLSKQKKREPNVIVFLLEHIIYNAYKEHQGRYVGVSQLADLVSIGKDKRDAESKIRGNMSAIKDKFLDEGLLVSNKPILGYRLAIDNDIIIETVKKIEASFSYIINSMKILAKTDYDKSKLKEKERIVIRLSADTIEMVLPKLSSFNENSDKKSIMAKNKEEIAELKDYLNKINSSVTF